MQRVYPAPRRPLQVPVKRIPKKTSPVLIWGLVGTALAAVLLGVMIVSLTFGVVLMVSSEQILPGVSAAGVPLGNLSYEEATAQLQGNFAAILVRDGERTWR